MLFHYYNAIPLVAAKKDMPTDDVLAAPCGELDIMGE
jgi:hypothetical protein